MENKEEVSVSGLISQEMYQTYNVYHTKKQLRILSIIVSIAYACFTYIFMDSHILFSIVFIPIMWGILTAILPLAIKKRAAKEYKSDTLIKSEISITINEDGIHQKVRRSETYFEWDDIITIKEYDEMFLFYVSKNKAVILPKKFLFKGDLQRLRRIIYNNAMSQKVRLKEKAV
ncbi:YcxB family protein [Bacillus sp. m3-13]|uniref:YcxB family protein n=1 Tax=Bacillus sp. m3-13 TaxID=406124 RepID=UPI0001E88FB5|nr:YcxB family protein [Bacillus sp. m3-13]